MITNYNMDEECLDLTSGKAYFNPDCSPNVKVTTLVNADICRHAAHAVMELVAVCNHKAGAQQTELTEFSW